MDNAFIEAFNGRFRRECLDENWFLSWRTPRRKWKPGEATTMEKGPTALWGTCLPESSPYWRKQEIDPQN